VLHHWLAQSHSCTQHHRSPGQHQWRSWASHSLRMTLVRLCMWALQGQVVTEGKTWARGACRCHVSWGKAHPALSIYIEARACKLSCQAVCPLHAKGVYKGVHMSWLILAGLWFALDPFDLLARQLCRGVALALGSVPGAAQAAAQQCGLCLGAGQRAPRHLKSWVTLPFKGCYLMHVQP
jgi:hypothetical protein